MKTALFDFDLPQERIALHPAEPRDASRMLVIKPDALEDSVIKSLPDFLRPGDIMVFNDTRVLPARLNGKRGEVKIEVTLHKQLNGNSWRAFAKPGKRLHVGNIISFSNDFSATVTNKLETGEIDLEWNQMDWLKQLYIHGMMPLPQYIKRDAEHTDNNKYQTIYASKDGAVAAPTAGLHFTEELLAAIDKKGVKRIYITLHVGGGTFLPVKADDTSEHKMHSEYAEISTDVAETINRAHQAGGRVIAVGTTTLRTLESATDDNGRVKAFAGETDIFITPGYRFKAVDILVTNFHLPKSTLFMLVSAFAGLERMKEAYNHAIEAKYRFYSYGDACLLLK